MNQFHAPDDEKRSIIVIPKGRLTCDHDQAMGFLDDMPLSEYIAAPKSNMDKFQLDMF